MPEREGLARRGSSIPPTRTDRSTLVGSQKAQKV